MLMNIDLSPGRYVLAVSGGVDSMALLHMLAHRPDVRLVVAHFDHGIRRDSILDRQMVQKTAKMYGLPFVYYEGQLGPAVSEAAARQARYEFLYRVRQAAAADAVVMAHHQNDVLETAIINLVRGTGRLGLTSLKSTDIVKRPFLHISKGALRKYARSNNLEWREDTTNSDPKYFRNHIRHSIVLRMAPTAQVEFHAIIAQQHKLNQQIDSLLDELLKEHTNKDRLDRRWFINLPQTVSKEVMAGWLRRSSKRNFDKKLLEQLVQGAKIHKVGRQMHIDRTTVMRIGRDFLALEALER